jgi:ubiquinone/menaquinone biosynthesis C-methylase UbiE
MTTLANDARFWDRVARKYSRDTIADQAGYEMSLERTIAHLRRSDIALEFGCGTGATALRLSPHVARLIATDISITMIDIAHEKAATSTQGNIEFKVSALDDDCAPVGSLDVVLGFNVLHLIDGRADVLHRIHRLLKPGGLFISKTPCLSDMNPAIRFALPVMQFFGKAPYVDCFTAVQLEAEIAAAGFTIIERGRHATKGKDTRPFFVAQRR